MSKYKRLLGPCLGWIIIGLAIGILAGQPIRVTLASAVALAGAVLLLSAFGEGEGSMYRTVSFSYYSGRTEDDAPSDPVREDNQAASES